ncbi:MAG: hypothetical protein WB588_03750 [Dehalococcoidia bacterium]|jgi:hypothetical protein
MKILQGFLIVMGALAVLAILAVIFSYVLALLTPDIRSNMREVIPSSEAVDSLNQKLDDLKTTCVTASSSDTKKDISLVLTEEEVNSALVMAMAEGTLPAKKVLVNFNDGYMLIYNTWSFPGLPIQTVIMGSLEVDNGKPTFLIKDFSLGKLPVPDSVDQGVQEIANILIRLNVPLQELKINLQDITISDGQIKITGVTGVTK